MSVKIGQDFRQMMLQKHVIISQFVGSQHATKLINSK